MGRPGTATTGGHHTAGRGLGLGAGQGGVVSDHNKVSSDRKHGWKAAGSWMRSQELPLGDASWQAVRGLGQTDRREQAGTSLSRISG